MKVSHIVKILQKKSYIIGRELNLPLYVPKQQWQHLYGDQ